MGKRIWDVYKTWTPGQWTISVDLVHRRLRGPGPWTTPRGPPLTFEDEFSAEV